MKSKKQTPKKRLRVLCAATFLMAANFLSAQQALWGIQAVHATNDQQINDVAVDGDGDAYAVGFFKGQHSFYNGWPYYIYNSDLSGNTYDGFLVKYAREDDPVTGLAAGDSRWVVPMGGSGNDYTTSVTVRQEGNKYVLYVCGHFNGTMTFNSADYSTTPYTITSHGGQDGYIAKFDDNGIFKWAYAMGGTGNDAAYDISATTAQIGGGPGISGSAVYVCGSFASNITFDGGTPLTLNNVVDGNDAYLVRYLDDIGSPSVDPAWARGMGAQTSQDCYYGVASGGDGRVVVNGVMRSSVNDAVLQTNGSGGTTTLAPNGGSEAIAACYDASGLQIWSNHYGGSSTGGSNLDVGLSAAMDGNGTAYLSGYFTGTGIFGTYSNTSLGGTDSYVMSVSSTGNVQWAKAGGTTNSDDMITSLAVDNCGQRVYAGGQYRGTFNFPGISPVFTFPPYNTTTPNIDAFFMTLDAINGNGISGDGIQCGGSDGIDNRTSVAVNALEDVYVGGSFASTNWYFGIENNFINTDNPASNRYDSYLYRWDNINFPANVTSGNAGHKGAGMDDCKIYAAGEMTGTVTFGSTTLSSTSNSQDVYLTTCNKYGNYTSFVNVVKGNAAEYLEDQYTDASGNNYLCGSATTNITQYSVTFNNGTTFTSGAYSAAWMCKTNGTGTVQWANWITANNTLDYSNTTGITCDANGDVYCCGSFNGTVTFSNAGGTPVTKTSVGATDMFVAKYAASNGALLWLQTFSPTTSSTWVVGTGITVLGSDYYVCGRFKGTTTIGANTLTSSAGYCDMLVMRGNTSNASNGAAIYSLMSNMSSTIDESAEDIAVLATNAVYIAGSVGAGQAFLGKANLNSPSPSWTWTRTNSGGSATGYKVATHNGMIFLGGTCTSGTLTFGSIAAPGIGAFIIKYESGGTEQCINSLFGRTLRGMVPEVGMLNSDGGDGIIMTGGSSAFIYKAGFNNCFYTNRLAEPGQTETESNAAGSFNVYPNPTTDFFTIETGVIGKKTVVITDVTGRLVFTQTTNEKTLSLDLRNEPNGVYFVQVTTNDKSMTQQLIKQ